ncbi:MAG TPA: protein rep, partial [Polyangia bacterium]|nr:protein rep [Polyangia bacterium]
MPVEVYDERDVQKTRRMRFNAAKFILPGWRTLQGCGCRLIDSKQGVSAMVSAAPSGGSHVRFANTARCGSVWSCPLCAASVTEGRAQELTRAVDAWCKAGNTVVMVTLTNSHRAHESLCDQMTGLRDALADLKASRTYKDARLDLGSHGSVRSLEVTWGEDNGWHPHIHQIEFIKGIHEPAALTAKLGAFQDSVFPVWSSACTSNGLGAPSLDRGINFVHGKTVNERIAE